MSLPKLVPWYDDAEFAMVGGRLFSGDPSERAAGAEHVAMWSGRGRCPIEAECSAQLVRLLLQYEQTLRTGVPADDEVWQLAASLALVRLISGVCDAQQQGTHARSIASVATHIGIPLWLVDVRHHATHMVLPSTDILNAAMLNALVWLRSHFWSARSANRQMISQSVRDMIQTYADIVARLASLEASSSSSASASSCSPSLSASSSGPKRKRDFANPAAVRAEFQSNLRDGVVYQRDDIITRIIQQTELLGPDAMESALVGALIDSGLGDRDSGDQWSALLTRCESTWNSSFSLSLITATAIRLNISESGQSSGSTRVTAAAVRWACTAARAYARHAQPFTGIPLKCHPAQRAALTHARELLSNAHSAPAIALREALSASIDARDEEPGVAHPTQDTMWIGVPIGRLPLALSPIATHPSLELYDALRVHEQPARPVLPQSTQTQLTTAQPKKRRKTVTLL